MALTIAKKHKNGLLIMGLDISTKAGVAYLDFVAEDGSASATPILQMQTLSYPTAASLLAKALPKPKKGEPKLQKPKATAEYNQFPRWQKYEDEFEALIIKSRPDFVVIEGYGFASQSLSIIVEVSTHFKRVLHRHGIPWIEVKPNALKKFVTGKGSGDKNVIMLEAFKRFGIDTKDDNQCDAACLAYLGATLAGVSPIKLPASNMEPLKELVLPGAINCNPA